jgi:hypothetical protein
MIVRYTPDTIQLITQPDHAQLAGRLMEPCVPLASRARRAAILLAIREHDNGWAEEDAAPGVHAANGRVVDFVTAPLSVRHSVWPRAVARLAGDPWAAALVAQHAITVYDRFRRDADWASFFADMTVLRDRMLQASGLPLDDLLSDYGFVRLADLISLAFCAGWTEEQRFEQWTVQLFGDRVVVAPDPFGGSDVPFAIAGREIPTRTFQSDAELRDDLIQARRIDLRGTVSGRR